MCYLVLTFVIFSGRENLTTKYALTTEGSFEGPDRSGITKGTKVKDKNILRTKITHF